MTINLPNQRDMGVIAKTIASDANKLATLADDMQRTYFSKGFNGGGANEIVDSDFYVLTDPLAPDTEDNRTYIVDITAAQIADMVNFAQNMTTWLNNGAPLAAFWQTTLDQVRDI